jgi:hypothetical protein
LIFLEKHTRVLTKLLYNELPIKQTVSNSSLKIIPYDPAQMERKGSKSKKWKC